MKEGKALRENSEAYYEELRDKLDLVLLFTEQGVQMPDVCVKQFSDNLLLQMHANKPSPSSRASEGQGVLGGR